MIFGILAAENDIHAEAVKRCLNARGADDVVEISPYSPIAFGDNFGFEANCDSFLSEVSCWYIRSVISPLPPAYITGSEYRLFDDWFISYMRNREKFSIQLAWLLDMQRQGVPMINPPENAQMMQLKPFQLSQAKKCGLTIPHTLITNEPVPVRAFFEEHDCCDIVYKPSMGGGLCRELTLQDIQRLDPKRHGPVTFQQRVRGLSVRATFVGDKLVSCVSIPSANLDYRNDPEYYEGRLQYENIELPRDIIENTVQLLGCCGLVYSGVDYIMTDRKEFVFLEANSSPIYMDIEEKTGCQISDSIASLMIDLSNKPTTQDDLIKKKEATFVPYAHPYEPQHTEIF